MLIEIISFHNYVRVYVTLEKIEKKSLEIIHLCIDHKLFFGYLNRSYNENLFVF
jgi:hypothetical protein